MVVHTCSLRLLRLRPDDQEFMSILDLIQSFKKAR